ncbi:MerR family transcriptional regulator [Erysipelatoclostridium ramosum]|uniref:MerR family transcriptional regulator n=1 Tax=Thomasclavelia ramosa TaxID=1547 RepID=UPI001E5EE9EE|nr:MerR family transcriptional regulator [Thomasclavelia ramosa]MDB7039996.1 MerR family transcriptional regulator [Thomasclavelia ramosa]
MNEDYLTIGELAQKMDVTVRTLQYYGREGLLKPAAISKGGRRLYSTKDIVKLHQILSFKYLGFSLVEIKTKLFNLDTPQEVAAILNQQKSVIQEQIANLSEALEATIALSREVQEMNTVDFKKYAEIIELLRLGNKEYWV